MSIVEIIEKKKNNKSLSETEIKYFVDNFTNGIIADYQASSLLMAIWINGMNSEEIYWLTKAMLNSGEILEPKATNKLHISVDKHSSGGVGDKVSLILSPILVALGYDVAKLSGRGLSFTGGTIDKLESIGVDCEYDSNNYQNQLNKSHMFLMIQGSQIVPADKKMYALRDVTGTVDSLPLIAASIMSKKLAIKTDYIFLDIKVGSGAFCKTLEQAQQLAKIMLDISKKFNRKTIIHLTNMSSPLGKCIGNAIEIKEAIDFLNGNYDSIELKKLIFEFASDILIDTSVCGTKQDAYSKINEVIENKSALNAFLNYVKNQNGYIDRIQNNTYWQPKNEYIIVAEQSGFINYKSASEVGLVSALMGGGRFKKEDQIDFDAGIYLNKESNDYVNKGEIIATLYSNSPIKQDVIQKFKKNIEFKSEKNHNTKIIMDIIK